MLLLLANVLVQPPHFVVEVKEAHYYHCAKHRLNVSTAQVFETPEIEHAQQVIKFGVVLPV